MTSPTDTPKRDVANLDAFETWFASLTRMERDQRFSASYFMREAWNAALRLPTPPSQGKVERAREIAVDIVAKNMIRGEAAGPAYVVKLCIAAITQALTETSGQGTDGACCEAMREAAAKKVEGEVIHHRFRTWPWWGDGNRDKQDALVQFCDLCAKAIRALPPSPVKRDLTTAQADLAAALRTAGSLPDSTYVHDSDVRISFGTLRALAEATVKESRDAVIEACARWYDEHGWELDPMNVSAHMKRALKSTSHQGGDGE